MPRKLYDTPSGGKSRHAQPDKERYQEIVTERNRRAIKLGAVPYKRKKRNKNGEGTGYDSIKEQIQDNCVIDPISGCWIWLKPLQNVGYGVIEVPRTAADGPGPVSVRDGLHKVTKTRTVHRVSYEEFVGPIPKGRVVAHTCDTTYCCNPDHLWLGTRKQNSEDMVRKGRAQHHGLGGNDSPEFLEQYFKVVQCPHCEKEGVRLGMLRWHFDNCKHKPVFIETATTIPEFA